MEPGIAGWILEFLIKQNEIDDETLNKLIHILPLPNHNPRLKKSLLLRKIDSDIKTGTISDHTLDLLESIIELDISQRVYNPSEALKLAYGALTMYFSIKSIENDDDIEFKSSDVLKRLCSEMEACDNEMLLSWVKDIEEAGGIMEVDVFKESDVVEVLSRYVREAREMMGPSFIELACDMVFSHPGSSKDLDNQASRAQQISHRRSGTHRGAKILDPMEASHDQCDGIPTPEVDRVKDALEKSLSGFNAVVKDPLPEALRFAESLNVNTSGEHIAPVGGSTRNNDEVPSLGLCKVHSEGNEASRARVLPQNKQISHQRSGTHRGAKIVDPMETSHDQCDGIPTPEVDRVKEALEKSLSELNAVVKDPLPEALRYAESLNVNTSGEPIARVGGSTRNNYEVPSLGLCKVLGLDGGVSGQDLDANVHSEGNEASRARVLPQNKQISHRRSGTHRGAKIVDPMETSHDQCDGIPTPEVDRVKEALEKSSSELNAVVKDPLPEALRYAESLNVNTSRENIAHVGGLTRNNDEVPRSSHDRKGKALEADGGEGLRGDQNKRHRPSLMERNSTAHTVEWSDSIENSDEWLPTRPHLDTPKKRSLSPLSFHYNNKPIYINKVTNQKKRRRWTVVEEDTLRTGVHKYGKGNWKLILNMYRDIFEDRTAENLKDKWRNLIG